MRSFADAQDDGLFKKLNNYPQILLSLKPKTNLYQAVTQRSLTLQMEAAMLFL